MSKYKDEVLKSIAIAKEFIKRAEVVLSEQEKVDQEDAAAKAAKEAGDKYAYNYYRVSNLHTSALKRQSMELTRQLAVMRRPHWR